jgi:mono/diheme cytochrome c family protein
MIAWFILLGLIALAAIVFALLPLRNGGAQDIRIRSEREELEDELNAIYAQVRDLEKTHADGEIDAADYERFRSRDEARAAKMLERIDALPKNEARAPTPARRINLGRGATLFGLTAIILGSLSAFAVPNLERWALRPGERELYDNQRELLDLGKRLNNSQSSTQEPPLRDLLRYGDVAWELDRYEDAAKGYGAALRQLTDQNKSQPQAKLEPAHVHALSRYGQILFFSGENDQALELLRTAAKFDNAEAYLTIGNILFSSKNDPQGAIEAWQSFQKVNTDKELGARIPDLIAAARTRLRASDPGAQVFAKNCAGCHGAEAQGLVGPNLKTSSNARSADFVRRQLANGSPNKQMPAFKSIQGKDLENLIKYVNGLK